MSEQTESQNDEPTFDEVVARMQLDVIETWPDTVRPTDEECVRAANILGWFKGEGLIERRAQKVRNELGRIIQAMTRAKSESK